MQLGKNVQLGDDSHSAALDRALDYCVYLQEEFTGAEVESGSVMLNSNQVNAYCWMLRDIQRCLDQLGNSHVGIEKQEVHDEDK